MSEHQRGSGNRPALSRLIPIGTDEFADEYWGARPLVTEAADLGGDFSDLFSLDAVDELVADRAVRTPFVRMAHEGSVLPPTSYTSGGGYGAEIGDQLDSEKVLSEFAAGATLVLQGLHRTWPALADFIRRLDADLGYPCQVNAYVTPASSRGFDPHYDVHDVFVIQIHGAKSWTIHEPVYADPLGNQPWSDRKAAVAAQAAGEPYLEHTFTPGDVLYLPRGWIHSATALGGTTIHLTIGIATHTRYDIVAQALSRLADDPALRGSLPLGMTDLGSDAVREIVERTLTDARDALGGDGFVDASVAELTKTLRGFDRPAPVHPLATIEALNELAAETVVRWRPALEATVDRGDTTVDIRLRSKTVSLPIEAASAIESAHDGEPVAAGHLPGLDVSSSLVVARRLVREAILVIA
jgi:ribosomal protein L16 Arg81 hydroxylase